MNGLESLSSLFNNKIFRIPDYQRGYAWGDKQLDDFWEDLVTLPFDRFHYTGMLSLKELNKNDYVNWVEEKWILNDGAYRAFHVVDGQQRLTTFIILLSCILDLAKKNNIKVLNHESVLTIKKKYIVETDEEDNILKAYKFGYEVDNPSFQFLRSYILGEETSGDLEETFYTLKLKQAKDFFNAKLDIIFEKNGKDALEELYKKLTNRLQFNIHYIDDDFDVYVAFETMNNRGKKLSNLEILKNRLIYLTTVYTDSQLNNDKRIQLRKDINDAWKEVYKELGRNSLNPLNDDEYLKAHWTMFFTYSRNMGDDYIHDLLGKRFNQKAVLGIKRFLTYDIDKGDEIDEDNSDKISLEDASEDTLLPKDIHEYVKSLEDVAKYWYYSFNPFEDYNLTKEEQKWIDRLNRIGINYFRTTVVATMMRKDASPSEKVELYKTVEKFIFLCFRMARYQASYYSASGYKFARDLLHSNTTVSEVTKLINDKFNENIDNATNIFASKIQDSFKNKDGYYSWYDLKYFLFEYEAWLAEKYTSYKITSWDTFIKNDKDTISIEHIFPQTPTRWYWRNQFRNFNVDEQKAFCNSLGNLLPLSRSINSYLQNQDFSIKKNLNDDHRRGYAYGCHSENEVSKCSDWGPTEIKNRGLALLNFMENRWGFKFPIALNRLELLGIPFVDDSRDTIPELVKDDVEDRNYVVETGDIKLSEYLNEKSPESINLYQLLFSALKEKIPNLVDHASTVYIALRIGINGQNFADVWLQKSQLKVIINTPQNPENLIGEQLADSYNWSKQYKILIKRPSDISKSLNAILESAEISLK